MMKIRKTSRSRNQLSRRMKQSGKPACDQRDKAFMQEQDSNSRRRRRGAGSQSITRQYNSWTAEATVELLNAVVPFVERNSNNNKVGVHKDSWIDIASLLPQATNPLGLGLTEHAKSCKAKLNNMRSKWRTTNHKFSPEVVKHFEAYLAACADPVFNSPPNQAGNRPRSVRNTQNRRHPSSSRRIIGDENSSSSKTAACKYCGRLNSYEDPTPPQIGAKKMRGEPSSCGDSGRRGRPVQPKATQKRSRENTGRRGGSSVPTRMTKMRGQVGEMPSWARM